MTIASPAPEPGAPAAPAVDPNEHLDDTPPEAVNWEALSDRSVQGNDEPDNPDPAITPPPNTPTATPSPTPTPTAAPVAPATPAPSAPAVTPEPTPAPTPAPTPSPTPAPISQEEYNRQSQEARNNAIAAIEKQYVSELSDEDRRSLLTDPEKVIPKLMARAVIDGMQMAVAMNAQHMQSVLPAQLARNEASRKAEEHFYTVNADLNRPEFKSTVLSMAQTVASNPAFKAWTSEQKAQKIAELSRVFIGLPPAGTAAAPAAPAAAAPAAPARPFTPAAGGGSSPARPAGSPEKNIWAELAEPDL